MESTPTRFFLHRAKEAPGVPAPPWMITLCNLLTLLIAFFVLRLSMFSLEGKEVFEKFAAMRKETAFVIDDLHQGADAIRRISAGIEAPGTTVVTPAENPPDFLEKKQRSRVTLDEEAFVAATAELTFAGRASLRALALAVLGSGESLAIGGFARESECRISHEFPSCWELSLGRASAAARQLIDSGVEPRAISVAGYGSSKGDSTEKISEGRTHGRLVEISILREGPDAEY